MKPHGIHALSLAVVAAFAALSHAAFAEQPDKFVRYVEATGEQYVDTGITGRHGTKAECKVEWMNLADNAFVACGYWLNNIRFYACWCSTTSGNMFTAQRTGDKVNNGQDLLFEKKRVYTYMTDFSAADGNQHDRHRHRTQPASLQLQSERRCAREAVLGQGSRLLAAALPGRRDGPRFPPVP